MKGGGGAEQKLSRRRFTNRPKRGNMDWFLIIGIASGSFIAAFAGAAIGAYLASAE